MNTLKLCSALIALSLPLSSSAAIFIKIDDIQGESEDTTSTTVPVPVQLAPASVGCAEDRVRCADGTFVGRDINNDCQFFPCSPTRVSDPVLCTLDAKICPDGSAVGRDGSNNCEFFPCSSAPTVEPIPTPGALPVYLPIKTSGEDVPPATQIDPPSLQLDAGPADTSKKGNVEATYKVEEGESDSGEPDRPVITGNIPNAEAKKAREIVVVGSKVKDETEEQKKARIDKATPKLQQALTSVEQLPEYLQALVDTDENIARVSVIGETVSMSYLQRAKLFGFIPVNYSMKTSVVLQSEDYGRVKVQLPWWTIFARDNADDIVADMNEELANIDLQNVLQKTQQALQTMSNVSKMHHDTAMTVIRKS